MVTAGTPSRAPVEPPQPTSNSDPGRRRLGGVSTAHRTPSFLLATSGRGREPLAGPDGRPADSPCSCSTTRADRWSGCRRASDDVSIETQEPTSTAFVPPGAPDPEVRLAHPRVVGQVGRLALEHDRAALDDVGAVGDRQRLGGVLLDDQHRHAGVADPGDRLQHLDGQVRRQADRPARRGSGTSGAPSGPGRWPASAAGRRTSCPPAGGAARRGSGTGRRPRRGGAAPSSGTGCRRPISRFSTTWRLPKSARSWATCTRPERTRRCAGRPCTSSPSKRIRPPRGADQPAIARSVVVLPAPLAPMRETISPRSTCSVRPCRISRRR